MARRFYNRGVKAIGGIPRNVDPQTRLLLQSLKEGLETVSGQRGNEYDTAVTWRDLLGEGIVEFSNGGLGGSYVPGGSGYTGPFESTTVPGTPYNVTTFVGIDFVGMTWDIPAIEYVSYYEILRNTVDDQSTAVFHGVAGQRLYSDYTVAEGSTYYYWVRAVSYGGIPGQYQSLAGIIAVVGLTVDTILGELAGQISETELVTSLNSRIDLVDAPGTGLVTQVDTLSTTSGDHTASISTLETVVTGAGGLSSQWMVKTDVDGYVAGFGLYNNGAASQFIVNAETFAVGTGTEPTEYPFIIGNVDGLPRIVLNAATYIPDATITNAKIDTVTADKIYVNSGTIADVIIGSADISNAMIGNVIQSTTFNPTAGIGWKLDKAGTFEAASITIRDSGGNIIMDSGGTYAAAISNSLQDWNDITGIGLPAPYADVTGDNTAAAISGQGALATANSADWSSQVAGTGKPANYADVTSANPQGATWLTNAVVGDHNKITSTNIDTYINGLAVTNAYIGNAAVTNAKIANAAVGTLSLAGQAVTIPASVSATNQITGSSSTSFWYNLLSVAITRTGAPVNINFCAYVTPVVTSALAAFRIRRSGPTADYVVIESDDIGFVANYPSPSVGSTVDTTTVTGIYTYHLEARSGGGRIYPTSRSLTLLETKR